MRRNPGNRPAFEREGTTQCEEVFERPWNYIRTMCVQPMVAQTDSKSGAHPVKKNGDCEDLPAKKGKRRKRANMKENHDDGGCPVQAMAGDGNNFGAHLVTQRRYTPTVTRFCPVDCKSYVISSRAKWNRVNVCCVPTDVCAGSAGISMPFGQKAAQDIMARPEYSE